MLINGHGSLFKFSLLSGDEPINRILNRLLWLQTSLFEFFFEFF